MKDAHLNFRIGVRSCVAYSWSSQTMQLCSLLCTVSNRLLALSLISANVTSAIDDIGWIGLSFVYSALLWQRHSRSGRYDPPPSPPSQLHRDFNTTSTPGTSKCCSRDHLVPRAVQSASGPAALPRVPSRGCFRNAWAVSLPLCALHIQPGSAHARSTSPHHLSLPASSLYQFYTAHSPSCPSFGLYSVVTVAIWL